MLSIAVIGAGRIGHVHAKTIAAHPQAELALVCDPFEDAAEKLAATYGARSCKDVEEVFADPEIDAVIVGSPTPLHIPHLLAAAKAGKAVLCEKPIALDMKDVEAAQAELDAVTVPVMFGFNRRFDPSFAAARAAVEAGKIGDIEQLTIISRDPAAPPAEYIKVSGGIFRDMTIHDFDTARFFLGEIEEVYAAGQNLDPALKDTGDFDAAVVTLKAASGAVATIINNRHCSSGYDQRLEASGREGALFAENIRATTVRLSNGEVTDAQEPYLDFFLERYADAYRIELSAFIEAVEAGTTPPTGIEDAQLREVLSPRRVVAHAGDRQDVKVCRAQSIAKSRPVGSDSAELRQLFICPPQRPRTDGHTPPREPPQSVHIPLTRTQAGETADESDNFIGKDVVDCHGLAPMDLDESTLLIEPHAH